MSGEKSLDGLLTPKVLSSCRRVAAKYFGKYDEAEEVFQEALLRGVRGADKYDSAMPISPWLNRVTANTAIDLMRKRTRSPPNKNEDFFDTFYSIDEDPQSLAQKNEEISLVREAVSALPSKYRKIVESICLKMNSYEEVSAREKISLGTLKSRVHAAKKRLKKILSSSFYPKI